MKLALLKYWIQFTIYINKNLEIESVLINLNFIPKLEQTCESHLSSSVLDLGIIVDAVTLFSYYYCILASFFFLKKVIYL